MNNTDTVEELCPFPLPMQQRLRCTRSQPKYGAARLFFVSVVIICGLSSLRLLFDGRRLFHKQYHKVSRDVNLANNEVIVKNPTQVANPVNTEVSFDSPLSLDPPLKVAD